MNKVYAVGVLQLDLSDKATYVIKQDRLWCLYAKFEEAEQAVLQNRGDLFEYYYNYALIEETLVIDHSSKGKGLPFPPREWWYKAEYNGDGDITVTSIDKPEQLDKTVYFWTG